MQKKLLVSLLSLLFIADAHAYLDGGTGSMILQLLLGGAVGLSAVVKLYWHRIKSFFSRTPSKD